MALLDEFSVVLPSRCCLEGHLASRSSETACRLSTFDDVTPMATGTCFGLLEMKSWPSGMAGWLRTRFSALAAGQGRYSLGSARDGSFLCWRI